MSGKPGVVRKDRVLVLYSNEEYKTVRKLFARSTCRTISGYVRKVSLEEPVGMIVRNGSFDAFVEEIIVLRKAMTEIFLEGKWGGAREERLVQLHEEIKLLINKIAELCTPH